MVDITTIQVNPIPPPIQELQKMNTALNSENKLLRKIIIVTSIIVVLTVANEIHKQIKYKNERNRKGLQ